MKLSKSQIALVQKIGPNGARPIFGPDWSSYKVLKRFGFARTTCNGAILTAAGVEEFKKHDTE